MVKKKRNFFFGIIIIGIIFFLSGVCASSFVNFFENLNERAEQPANFSLNYDQLARGVLLEKGLNTFTWPQGQEAVSVRVGLSSLGSSWIYLYENFSEKYYVNPFGDSSKFYLSTYSLGKQAFEDLIPGKNYKIFMTRASNLTYPSNGYQDFACKEIGDEGKDTFKVGYIEYILKGELVRDMDNCSDISYLLEYFCEDGANKVEKIYCPYDCEKSNCRKSFSKKRLKEQALSLCTGCVLNEKCYKVGYRKNGKYCSENKTFVNQFVDESPCKINFECRSRICLNETCMYDSLIEQIFYLKSYFDIQLKISVNEIKNSSQELFKKEEVIPRED